MDIFYTPSMIWGPLRLLLFFVLVYALNLITVRRKSISGGMDYFMKRYTISIALLVISILVLTQLDSYDLLVVLAIFTLLLLFNFLNLSRRKPLLRQLYKIRRRSIIYMVKSTDQKQRWISSRNLSKPKLTPTPADKVTTRSILKYQLIIGAALAILAYASRYFFISYDSYLLSDLWYADLARIKDLSLQHWFFNQGTMMGEFAIISFYSDITGITDAVALTSFGLIEAALLTISMFWSVNKLMGNTIVSGMIAALSFTVLYIILPLNIDLITQPKSVFLALSLALPYLVFLTYPTGLKRQPRRYAATLFLLVLALFFIDFFVTVCILPVFLVTHTLVNLKARKRLVGAALGSYVLAVLVGLLVLWLASLVQVVNLSSYLYSNLYNYNSYTYTPQLILPLETLTPYYAIAALLWLGLATLLYATTKGHRGHLTIAVITTVLVSLLMIRFTWIDSDLLLQVICVFIPVLLTGLIYSVYMSLQLVIKKDPVSLPLKIAGSVLVFGLLIFVVPMDRINSYPKKNPIYGEILSAYDFMNAELLPYSYALVHNDKNSRLSSDKHFFLDYQSFIDGYLEKDRVYQNVKKDEGYLKQHPEVVLPQSVYVFSYTSIPSINGVAIANPIEQAEIRQQLQSLRERGRTVTVFFKTKHLTVYEIVNVPKSSKVTDLLL